ncbi:MAG: LD-carboxypeptidase [Firmicutes bacterium]|nr:LD-carboxypeptidase [Bacillota bacterium]
MKNIIIPPRLQEDDQVAVIAPSSPVKSSKLKKAADSITALGLIPVIYPSCSYSDDLYDIDKIAEQKTAEENSAEIPADVENEHIEQNEQLYRIKPPDHLYTGSPNRPYLSAPDIVRANDINNAFSDDNIKGIFCVRGGYGSLRLAELIDYDIVHNNPKPFIGLSDISFLQLAFLKKSSLATFHAPMPSASYIEHNDEFTMESLKKSLLKDDYTTVINCRTVRSKNAAGHIIASNLTMLYTLLGTPFEPDTSGCILFLEDINEPLYKIDRMLTALRLAGKFEACSAIVFGYFTGCCKTPADELILSSLMEETAEAADCAALSGLPFGHDFPCITLPTGGFAEISGNTVKITKQI